MEKVKQPGGFPRIGRVSVSCLGVFAASGLASGAVVVSDTEMADDHWSVVSYTQSSGGTSAGSQSLTGGNAGAFRTVVNTINSGGLIVGAHIHEDAAWNPGTMGALTSLDFSIDVRYISPFPGGDGQAFGLAAVQDGRVFYASYDLTGSVPEWTTFSVSDVVLEDFLAWDGGADIDADGSEITFGFYVANSSTGTPYGRTAGYDNFLVTLIPAPAGSVVLGAGLIAVRRRR